MAETFTVPPGCSGLRIEGSTARYPADSTGHVVVDNPRHAAKVATNGAAYFHKRVLGFSDAGENRCPNDRCRFVAFAFTKECPRCGTALTGARINPAGDGQDQNHTDLEEAMS